MAACALRPRPGSLSHRQRSWDSPFGAFSSRKVSGGVTVRIDPPTVPPASSPAAEAVGRPGGPQFLGLHPSESPWRPSGGLARQPLDAPLGLCLPGLVTGDLARAFTRTPLARFAGSAITRRTHRRLRVSISLRPASPVTMPKHPAWRGNPHRLLAPARSRSFGRKARRDMGSPCTVLHIAANQPVRFDEPTRPTAVAGTGLRC